MTGMRVGCHTFTWQAAQRQGDFEAILDAIAAAGYAGVETTPLILGDLLDRPERARALIEARGLTLAALALSTPTGWTEPAAAPAEWALVERAITFLEAFGPGARLALGGGRSDKRTDLDARWAQMLRMYHAVAERAVGRGLVVNVHPTSEHTSIVRHEAEYERLVAALDPALLSLGPDTGHLVRGRVPVVPFLERHVDRITHIHLKDAELGGDYAFMGTGDVDLPGVVDLLRARGYAGWVVAEEESPAGLGDPAATVRACRRYLGQFGL